MKYRFHQNGASLIEVLVAIVIVGFGLLGIAGMQLSSISMASSSYYRGVAVDLGVDLAERIRAIRSPYMATADAATQPGKPPDFSKCVPNGANAPTCSNQDADRATYQNLVNSEMQDWNSLRLSQLPPGSNYNLESSQSGSTNNFRYKLTLTWLDNSKGDTDANRNGTYVVYIE
jgi:type IV pilus assembly protein PilV